MTLNPTTELLVAALLFSTSTVMILHIGEFIARIIIPDWRRKPSETVGPGNWTRDEIREIAKKALKKL